MKKAHTVGWVELVSERLLIMQGSGSQGLSLPAQSLVRRPWIEKPTSPNTLAANLSHIAVYANMQKINCTE